MKNPLISIITVTYNDCSGLEKTLQSVQNQTYRNIEHIIIDGGSIDATFDIIKKYENGIHYWVSEKDEGIYDAMNKGIDIANGDFVIFMNAGDGFYEPGTVEKVLSQINDMDKAYFGRAKVYSDYTSWVYPNLSINEGNIAEWLRKESPNHQAIFFPNKFYKNEKYNLKYKIFGDAEYKYRVKEFSGFEFIDLTVCKFSFGGISSSFDSYKDIKIMMNETWSIGRKYKGFLYTFKRIFIYNIKYFSRIILKEKRFLSFVRKIKN